MPSRLVRTELARALLLAGIALALAGTPTGAAHAAVGADNFGDAPPLLFSEPGTVESNAGYTVQGGEPVGLEGGCTSVAMTRTAWWEFTGTGQPITLSTSESTFDTVLAVYDTPTGIPIAGNREGCNDDAVGSTSALTFDSDRGKTYLVQVGSRGSVPGRIDVRATGTRPANDDRIDAEELATGVPVPISNAGASQEPGELETCGTARYAATMWFTWTAPAVGDAAFSSFAAFGDTAVTVYTDGAPVGCNTGTTATVAVRVAPGSYAIQVASKGSNVEGLGVGQITTRVDFTLDPDVDNDGELASTDCDDRDPTRRHGIADAPDDGVDQNCDGADAVNLDRDGDGEARPGDCDDTNPDINHGARDIPGNKIDEDCADGPAPFPRLRSSVSSTWVFPPFRFTKLQVLNAVAGSKVELRCKGGGCPFKEKTLKVRKSRARLSLLGGKLKRAELQQGAKLDVRITKPRHVGVMRRHFVRSFEDATFNDFCLGARSGKPKRC